MAGGGGEGVRHVAPFPDFEAGDLQGGFVGDERGGGGGGGGHGGGGGDLSLCLRVRPWLGPCGEGEEDSGDPSMGSELGCGGWAVAHQKPAGGSEVGPAFP